jgi:hypothetical protein
MGKGSFAATADDGDDAAEVGISQGCAGREAKTAVEKIFSHLSPTLGFPGFLTLPVSKIF